MLLLKSFSPVGKDGSWQYSYIALEKQAAPGGDWLKTVFRSAPTLCIGNWSDWCAMSRNRALLKNNSSISLKMEKNQFISPRNHHL